jgi:glycogen operon protein
VKLIAEPWDCGPGGFQVGGFPPGWTEWNSRFRDNVRDFWRGNLAASELADQLCASERIFHHDGRRPWSSVNFITAHDGFTLNDVVSYNQKHNEANRDDNRDGNDDNRSWNCGVEGPTDDPAVNALRMRQMRNLMATLLLSQGTPMILAGDEFARTQQGNNNAYSQNNQISWVNWDLAKQNECLIRFVRRLIRLRHKYPALRRNLFLNGDYIEDLGVRDVTWINPRGLQMSDENWSDSALRCFGMLLDGRAQMTGIRQRGKEATILLIVNGREDDIEFTMPECTGACQWSLLVDTNRPDVTESSPLPVGGIHHVGGRSLLAFVADSDIAPGDAPQVRT